MVNQDEMWNELQKNTAVEEASDTVVSSAGNDVLQYSLTNNIHVPKSKEQVVIDVNVIKRIDDKCSAAKKKQFPFGELFLGIASLFGGALLSALVSGTPYEFSLKGVISYTIAPFCMVGFGVAYGFFRYHTILLTSDFAEKIEEDLKEVKEVIEKDEH